MEVCQLCGIPVSSAESLVDHLLAEHGGTAKEIPSLKLGSRMVSIKLCPDCSTALEGENDRCPKCKSIRYDEEELPTPSPVVPHADVRGWLK